MTTPNDAAGTAFLEGAIAAVSGDGGDEARESRRAAEWGSDGDEIPGAHAERAEGVGVRADLGVGVAGASGGVGVRREGDQGTRERRDAWTDVWATVATTMKGDLYATSSR